MALVRKTGEDADARRAIDRSRQVQDQWRAHAESKPPCTRGRRRDGHQRRRASSSCASRARPSGAARPLWRGLSMRTSRLWRPLQVRTSRGVGRVPPSAIAGASTPSRPTMLSLRLSFAEQPVLLEPWPCQACPAWHGLPCTGCAIGIGKAPHRPRSRGSKSRGRVAKIGPNGRYALSQVG